MYYCILNVSYSTRSRTRSAALLDLVTAYPDTVAVCGIYPSAFPWPTERRRRPAALLIAAYRVLTPSVVRAYGSMPSRPFMVRVREAAAQECGFPGVL